MVTGHAVTNPERERSAGIACELAMSRQQSFFYCNHMRMWCTSLRLTRVTAIITVPEGDKHMTATAKVVPIHVSKKTAEEAK